MFLFKINLPIKLILTIYLIHILSLVTCLNSQDMQDPEKIMKKSKVLACIALTKARLAQDEVNEFN